MPTITASPTTVSVASDSGTVDWSGVNETLVEDTVCATGSAVVPHLATITSKAIKATGFDFSALDDSDVINSISLEVVRKSDRTFTNLTIFYLIEMGVVTGTAANGVSYWTESLLEETITRTINLPTAATIKNSTSGVAVVSTFFDSDGATVTASIDAIRLVVDYTDASRERTSLSGVVGFRPLLGGIVGLRSLLSGVTGVK